MDKVKITREQDAALKDFIENNGKLEHFIKNKGLYQHTYASLNDIPIDEFSFILNGYYETVREVEVGDWYEGIRTSRYAKITEKKDGKFLVEYNRENYKEWHTAGYILHNHTKVENKLKTLLLNEGRKEPKLRFGDAYVDFKNNVWRVDSDQFINNYALSDFENDKVKVFFPVEKGIIIQ